MRPRKQNLTGGSDTDTFKFRDVAGGTGFIDGGAGVNTLDYSAYASNVLVNLQTGLGTGVGSLANIQSVIGGNRSGGYNILVGNGGKYLQAARAGATCSSRVPRPARGSAATVMMF